MKADKSIIEKTERLIFELATENVDVLDVALYKHDVISRSNIRERTESSANLFGDVYYKVEDTILDCNNRFIKNIANPEPTSGMHHTIIKITENDINNFVDDTIGTLQKSITQNNFVNQHDFRLAANVMTIREDVKNRRILIEKNIKEFIDKNENWDILYDPSHWVSSN